MSAHLGDGRITVGDRVKVRAADAIDSTIDRARLRLGRVLTRVQNRCRRIRDDHSPAVDPAELAYHRQMMIDDRVSPAVSARLAELRRDREAVSA